MRCAASISQASYMRDEAPVRAPDGRGSGAGRALVESVIRLARDLGYTFMRLDTHPATMGAAVKLYREFGFRGVAADPMPPVEGLCVHGIAALS